MPNEMMMDPNSVVREGEMSGMPMDPNSVVREGEMDMRRKEQLELVLTFLQNITPGDMSPEAAEQLMNMGRGLTQGGPLLDDNQVKALRSVVGARDRFPTEQMATFPQGNTNPDIMKDPMSSYQVDGQTVPMTQEQYGTEMQSGNITPDMPRPRPRPTGPMTSPRPQMRR